MDVVRAELKKARVLSSGGNSVPSLDSIVSEVCGALARLLTGPHRAINATGTLLHTNLGRAPLSTAAREAAVAAAGYTDLEFDLATGKRGSRQEQVGALISLLVGAESGMVTGNNAGAVLLALSALARGREVLVSRGQAVEIGGGFRVPDILRQSGARLVEVGTTNRTYLSDYSDAISPRTAAILHVHRSNFVIEGFAVEPTLEELSALARSRNILLIDDNGSGALLDTGQFGLPHEPMPAESMSAGAHLVAFSGDKLLGGPQAGILAGESAVVQRLARHPLTRALRPDKTVLAALVATLQSYVRGDAVRCVPLWRMISTRPATLRERALSLAQRPDLSGLDISVEEGLSTVGGGALPTATLPTWVAVLPGKFKAADLLRGTPAVIGRTVHGRVHLDMRTVEEENLPDLAVALARAAGR